MTEEEISAKVGELSAEYPDLTDEEEVRYRRSLSKGLPFVFRCRFENVHNNRVYIQECKND